MDVLAKRAPDPAVPDEAQSQRVETPSKPKSNEFISTTRTTTTTTTATVTDIPSVNRHVSKAPVAPTTPTTATTTATTAATTTTASVILSVYCNLRAGGGVPTTTTQQSGTAVHLTTPSLLPPTTTIRTTTIRTTTPTTQRSVVASIYRNGNAGGKSPPTGQSSAPLRHFGADECRSGSCRAAPLFIVLVSVLEIGVFVYDYLTVTPLSELNSTSVPSESVLIYRPDRRLQMWRFVSYMVLHANWYHLGFNVVVQLLYGIPLEMVHGSLRIAVIYVAGVFAGSLGTSVVDSAVYLVGASGGVYALLAAQLANILLNFQQMRHAVSQFVSVLIFVSCDLGYAIYTKYRPEEEEEASTKTTLMVSAVSYVAHVSGFIAGITMGLLLLKDFCRTKTTHTRLLTWLAVGVYAACTVFAIAFNLINTTTAQMLEQRGELLVQQRLPNAFAPPE